MPAKADAIVFDRLTPTEMRKATEAPARDHPARPATPSRGIPASTRLCLARSSRWRTKEVLGGVDASSVSDRMTSSRPRPKAEAEERAHHPRSSRGSSSSPRS